MLLRIHEATLADNFETASVMAFGNQKGKPGQSRTLKSSVSHRGNKAIGKDAFLFQFFGRSLHFRVRHNIKVSDRTDRQKMTTSIKQKQTDQRYLQTR